MRKAAEQKQQLEAEHEQALAILNSKQQEIQLLQKAQVQANKEHEGTVHLLEVKFHSLEQKWRSQSEKCSILSKELEKLHLESDAVKFTPPDLQPSPQKTLCNILNHLHSHAGKGEPRRFTFKYPAPRSKARYTGQVRLCTARYSYNPYDGPNEHPEAELPLVAGKYIYVYGDMDDDGFYEGELLDGQRGLVPSNFVEFVQDKEKPSVDGTEELGQLEHGCLSLTTIDRGFSLDALSSDPLGPCSNGTGVLDGEEPSDDIVPYPRKINLIKQLARSVIVAWETPLIPMGWGNINGYNVLVDGEVRSTVPFGGRTKLLLEKLDLAACTYRVSVQCVTERGLSDELRCTLLVGRNVTVAPTGLRLDDILRDSADLSWLPSNSNYSHTVFLDGVEHAVVKPCCYRLRFTNLKATTVYKVKVVAKPHQVPWHMPLEQREKKEAGVEFCTQAAGPPLPPHEVQVQCGQAPGILQVRWKPPPLTPLGTSNGANVIGYAVCTKGQRVRHESLHSSHSQPGLRNTHSLCTETEAAQIHTAQIHTGFHSQNSDEEEDEESYQSRRRGASVDDFLRGSELGRQAHYSHSEEYQTESSRGSDLSDIMEEDEEELYSEMQLEEGRRRNSHNALKSGGNASSGRADRDSARRNAHGGPQPQRRPLMVPSIDGYRDRGRRSPPYYDESEPEDPFRIFVALFDYDPLSMSPNPDAADEELPFKEGQIIKVYGDKDTDGFYRGEIRGRAGLIPCNMVSEIRADDEETMDQLMKQGFLPLNTPVDRIEQNRKGGRHPVATRRMVALYDYDPRESSPNVDVEAELTFCAGDIIAVFGEIDEDGFYYGEMNGHRGLVPSNFLEEVPDDVEVYLTDTPTHYEPEEPAAAPAPRPEAKRVHHRRSQR
uniref:RIMS-binding protein 2 n=1 Tax=Astyanax mexicanus TaxID=7994 RepID=A0A8B9GUP7_ASTMX